MRKSAESDPERVFNHSSGNKVSVKSFTMSICTLNHLQLITPPQRSLEHMINDRDIETDNEDWMGGVCYNRTTKLIVGDYLLIVRIQLAFNRGRARESGQSRGAWSFQES